MKKGRVVFLSLLAIQKTIFLGVARKVTGPAPLVPHQGRVMGLPGVSVSPCAFPLSHICDEGRTQHRLLKGKPSERMGRKVSGPTPLRQGSGTAGNAVKGVFATTLF